MSTTGTKRQTLLIDFDGVLHDYHGWTGPKAQGPPIKQARAAMHQLSRAYRLVCFSTRPAEEVSLWLHHYGFPEMKVTNKKEPAHLIIDDRAIQFEGVWDSQFISRITSFSPHWSSSNAPEDAVTVQPEAQDLLLGQGLGSTSQS